VLPMIREMGDEWKVSRCSQLCAKVSRCIQLYATDDQGEIFVLVHFTTAICLLFIHFVK
jgi:hypothetical protein